MAILVLNTVDSHILKQRMKMPELRQVTPMTYAIDAFAGGWFEYRKNLLLQFGLPYTIYQNGSLFTKYSVLIQLAYRFKF